MAAVLFFSFILLLLLSSISPSMQDLRESVPLLRFKTSVNITNGDLHSWKTGTDPCNGKWFGIYCHKGKTVSGIHITGLGLSGTINVEDLQDLPNLRTIRLDNNLLSGHIPFFFLISGLRSLMLSNNSFSGEIPDDFFVDMTQIRRLFLDHNVFEGAIPSSIFHLPNIEEVHLQNNNFSGPVPELSPKTKILKTLDISNNNLTGSIPDSIVDRKDLNVTLIGNGGLCGEKGMGECKAPLLGEGENVTESQWNRVTVAVMITCFTLLSIFFIVIAIINKRNNKKQPEFLILDKGTSNENDAVHVNVTESIGTKKRGANIDGSSTKKGLLSQDNKDHVNGGGMSDIIMVNSEKGSFGLPDLMKAAAEVLGNGSLGSAYKAVMSNGLSVVVKRIRDMNKLTHEAFDVEMRRFGKLHHPNILTPLAYHYRREEKLVVSEYMPNSSLLYVLHGDRGVHHSELTWATRLQIIKGVAHGMQFLHEEFTSYDLPHGNLKSSNILLSETYEPLISDYAFLPFLNPNSATQTLFAFKTPDFAQTQQVSHKSDVYCFGIIILEILTGKFPSQYLNNGKGGTDIVQWVQSSFLEHKEEELIDPEIGTNVDSVQQIVEMLRIGVACIASNPDERLDMREVVKRIEQVTT